MARPHNLGTNRSTRHQRVWRWFKMYGKRMAACIISLAAVAHALGEFVQLFKSIGWW